MTYLPCLSSAPSVAGSLGTVRSLPKSADLDKTMGRMRFTNVSVVFWQIHGPWLCQVDGLTGRGAIILAHARSSAQAVTAEQA